MSLYLTATDPDVIAACERNAAGRKDFRRRAVEWAESRGGDGTFFPSSFAGTLSVRGLPFRPEGFGQWTKGDHRGCHWPYRNNAPETLAMSELTFRAEPVPGIPDALHAPGYLLWPTPFASLGAAWIGYSHMPEPDEKAKIGPQWSECLASQWHTAEEILWAGER